MILVTATGAAGRIAVAFTKPVIRSLQLAVGTLLVIAAHDLVVAPPEFFTDTPETGWSVTLAATTLIVVAIAVWRRWYAAEATLVALGTLTTWVMGDPQFGPVVLRGPTFAAPPVEVWGTAFVLLVIPQLPLTYGNAVVGIADLAREQFPTATRVRPGPVALSCGLGNIGSALLGGCRCATAPVASPRTCDSVHAARR